jgi:hypothetical protein
MVVRGDAHMDSRPHLVLSHWTSSGSVRHPRPPACPSGAAATAAALTRTHAALTVSWQPPCQRGHAIPRHCRQSRIFPTQTVRVGRCMQCELNNCHKFVTRC